MNAAARYPRRCRVCDCTDADCSACIALAGRPCHWVDRHTCSLCVADVLAPSISAVLGRAEKAVSAHFAARRQMQPHVRVCLVLLRIAAGEIATAQQLITRLERALMWQRYDEIRDEISAVLLVRPRGNLGIGVDRDRLARRYQRLAAESFALCMKLSPPTPLRPAKETA